MTDAFQIRAVALIAVLGALLLGCGSSGSDSDRAGPASPGGSLEVTYVVSGVTDAGRKRALVPGSEIRLAFSGEHLQITAGCNLMSGRYRLDATRLEVAGLASTEMGCEQPLMEQDAWVAGLFAAPVQLMTGNDAAVISGDVVLGLVDRRTVSPDLPLTGTYWQLTGTGDAQTLSSLPAGVVAWFRITDGTVRLYDGCNSAAGSVRVAGQVVTWIEVVHQLRGCRDPAVQRVASAVVEVLEGDTSVKIDEGRLTVTKGSRSLTFAATDQRPVQPS